MDTAIPKTTNSKIATFNILKLFYLKQICGGVQNKELLQYKRQNELLRPGFSNLYGTEKEGQIPSNS